MNVAVAPIVPAGEHAHDATIGPNSVIQLRAAMVERWGDAAAAEFFASVGHGSVFLSPPDEMIDEAVPSALFRALFENFVTSQAHEIAWDAGVRTADYVIANRIPSPVKKLLRVLPPGVSGPMLLRSIGKNAWTFAGSGHCQVVMWPRPYVTITSNPLIMPGAAWHLAVFTRLLRSLVCAESKVVVSRCRSEKGPVDRFDMFYGASSLSRRCGKARRRTKPFCIGCNTA